MSFSRATATVEAERGRRESEASPAARSAAPRAVTRGESPQQTVKVDWLNLTFPSPALSPDGFVALIGRMLGRPVSAEEGGGMLGFVRTMKLFAHHASERSAIGVLALGGESQRGRWMFQLTGTGCGFVDDWDGLREFAESLDAKITRLDLAIDFLEGQHTVDDAVSVYQMGGFTSQGRAPSHSVAGDWLSEKSVKGRTLYVGRATNGKMLRVYEKGRQLGDPDSEWVRFEVQLGSRDRVIPFEAMTDRDAFFGGCYPALQEMVKDAAAAIPTVRQSGIVSAAHLLHHWKRSYGKLMNVLSTHFGATNAELIEEVRIVGLPRRLNPSSLAAGVTWADVHAQSKKVH